jgi:site-specific DNA-adenine methylase
MFSYYGSKSKVVDLYPSPKFGKIIEPFAGSARYSLKWFDHDVLLVDKYEVIIKIWKWLQQASIQDIMSLPDVNKGDDIRMFNICDEAKLLIGFCINGGSVEPKNIGTDNINRNFNSWNKDKKRISNQLHKIRHWTFVLGSYVNIPNQDATWFIDPPYQFGGEHYKMPATDLDFQQLGEWCKSRNGQVIVCENTKADWLPFYPMRKMTGACHSTTEAIWSNYPHNFQAVQLSMFEPRRLILSN